MRGIFRYSLVVIFILLVGALFASTSHAAEPKNSGLLISPPRYNMSVKAGESVNQKATIANYTKQPLDITLDFQQFGVADFSYEYKITPVDQPWLKIEQTEVHLEPGESTTLELSARPPIGASPGGKYYLIVASATAKNGALTSTIQVAAPIYITVDGKLDTTSQLTANHGIDHIIFGSSIPFHLDVKNTGNVHYLIDVQGKLNGLSASSSTVSTDHILLPDTTRRFNSSIPAPLLPGIYRAVYGYSSDSSGDVLIYAWVLYLPPWAIIASIIVIWILVILVRIWLRSHKKTTDSLL